MKSAGDMQIFLTMVSVLFFIGIDLELELDFYFRIAFNE